MVRGRWWILLITPLVSTLTISVIYRIPNRYKSQATLVVDAQKVPTRYVTPTTETSLADALQAMTQDVLSRARLLALIDEFGLYAKERQRLAPEQLVELMRSYITIEPIDPASGDKDINSFRISFVAEKATLAQQVTAKLTSFFIEANLKTREDQATNTTNFLQAQLADAQTKLNTQEATMRDFKAQHLGELPEQQQSNLAILSATQQQLQNLENALDRAQQQRVYLESLINGYRRLAERAASAPGSVPGVTASRPLTPLQTAHNDLLRLQLERSKALADHAPTYYEIKALDRQIAAEQAVIAKLDASEKSQATAAPDPGSSSRPPQDAFVEDSATAQLQSQLEANRLEIRNIQKDEEQAKKIVAQYQERLNMTPVREQQLASIQRDYDLSYQNYKDLESKASQSQLATNLEKQQGGQQFRLVEPPSLPEVPTSPKRTRLSLMGLGGGLFAGLFMAFATDLARPKYHSTQEITRRLGAPLVIGLPVILTRSDKRRRIVKRIFEFAAGSVVALIMCIAEAYVLRHP
jgi:polysaccharide chain length determinant protein (PEP-CTERM system associated)